MNDKFFRELTIINAKQSLSPGGWGVEPAVSIAEHLQVQILKGVKVM